MFNKTRIIILNEEENFNKSFIINKFFIYCMILLFSCFIFFSIWGIFRFIKPHETTEEINKSISLKYNTIEFLEELIKKNKIDTTVLKNFTNYESYDLIVPNFMPVEGIVTKGLLGKDKTHHGIDIAAKLYTTVKAAQQGLVIFSGENNEYGLTVIIAHPNNYYTLYSHLEKSFVSQRQFVKQSENIGTIGESGKSDGPHLHFEIWKNNIIIDPRDIIKEYKNKDVSVK